MSCILARLHLDVPVMSPECIKTKGLDIDDCITRYQTSFSFCMCHTSYSKCITLVYHVTGKFLVIAVSHCTEEASRSMLLC